MGQWGKTCGKVIMAENTGNKVQIAFYGTKEMRRQLKRAALERGTSVQDLIEKAIARDFSEAGNVQENCKVTGLGTVPIGTLERRQQFAAGSEHLHMMVDFVIESGPPRLVNAMETALDAFANATQSYIEHGITRTTAASEDEETDSLLSEAREVTARAERTLRGEDTDGNGGSNGEDAPHQNYSWRKRA
jgi:hypothetical protein